MLHAEPTSWCTPPAAKVCNVVAVEINVCAAKGIKNNTKSCYVCVWCVAHTYLDLRKQFYVREGAKKIVPSVLCQLLGQQIPSLLCFQCRPLSLVEGGFASLAGCAFYIPCGCSARGVQWQARVSSSSEAVLAYCDGVQVRLDGHRPCARIRGDSIARTHVNVYHARTLMFIYTYTR